MYKLRTMVADAEFMGDGLAVNRGDPRITRVGAFLRRFSIDELPNLVNVVRGEMAFVGPRPTIQAQVDQYTERQMRRLEVKPGLTGWAQINGRASLPWDERIELDVWYVEHKAPLLDLKIVLRTIRMLVHRPRHLQGRDRRMDRPDRDVAVLLTGVGKRYDIVSAFAQHAFVVAADPSPLAPGAVRRRRPRRAAADRRSRLRPVPRGARGRARREGGDPADRPRPRGARALRTCPRSSPRPRSAARPTTSTRRTSCCSRTGCPARRPSCPARSPSRTR